jgi:hypothetical protein
VLLYLLISTNASILVVISTVLQETYCLVDINRKKIIITQECLSLNHLNCPVDSPELGTGFFWFSVCCGKGRKKHEFALFRARQFSYFFAFLERDSAEKARAPIYRFHYMC